MKLSKFLSLLVIMFIIFIIGLVFLNNKQNINNTNVILTSTKDNKNKISNSYNENISIDSKDISKQIAYKLMDSISNNENNENFKTFYNIDFLANAIKDIVKYNVPLKNITNSIKEWAENNPENLEELKTKINEAKIKLISLMSGNKQILEKLDYLGINISNTLKSMNFNIDTIVQYFQSIMAGLD